MMTYKKKIQYYNFLTSRITVTTFYSPAIQTIEYILGQHFMETIQTKYNVLPK